MEIDLVRLCAAAGARLIVGQPTGLDLAGRRLLFAGRPPLPYDVLSIGIGSVPKPPELELDGETVLAIKPMQTFLDRLDSRLRGLASRIEARALRVVIAGGGAGGTEVAFCLPPRIQAQVGIVPEITLVNATDQVSTGIQPRTAELVRREFESRGVKLILNQRVLKVADGSVGLENGEQLHADLILWATNAEAPAILATLGLPTDERGFLATRPTLQTTADQPIFAVGDSGTIIASPMPKAGVYAVRQGPILRKNLRRLVEKQPLLTYRPQKGFLKLLNTGDGRAIGEYRSFSFQGRWCFQLKNGIDSRFIDKYQDYRPMSQLGAMTPSPETAMRCAGCGGKVGGSILASVLNRLEHSTSSRVLVGLDAPDDAAVVRPSSNGALILSADFFAAPLDDPFLVGRLAALHAASDAFAMGAKPSVALALATVPYGRPRQQEQWLMELLSGGLAELKRMGTTLAGGHTIEGPQPTVGFTILAEPGSGRLLTKGGLRAGDHLILTKPLGTGMLLAAHMRAACRADWMSELLHTMLSSNEEASAVTERYDITSVTDITGFGLAGHLLEMLRASLLAAELHLNQLPLLPGVIELWAQQIESTLAPANRAVEAEIDVATHLRESAEYAVLFDPQTCGGLLLGVPEPNVQEVMQQLERSSDIPVRDVGVVREFEQSKARLHITP
jgi:selenide,water dikinase